MDEEQVITISAKDFLLGESSSDWADDGGFSPKSYNLNLTRIRGILDFAPSLVDRGGATLTGDVIAMCTDKTLSGNDAHILDDEGAVYILASNNALTKKQTITADTFTLGTSELIQYASAVATPFTFATSDSRIIRFTGPNLDGAAPDTDFWSGLNTGVRHPMEKVEDKLYFGDMNLIHAWDGATSTSAWVTLPPDVNITSLRKHPDGRNLIAFCGLGQNYSHTRNTPGRIYIVDTVLRDWIREIDTEIQVEGSRLVGGTVFVTYGSNVGYFTGDGIKFLKKLADSATVYSHNLGNMEDILTVRDGNHIRMYGDLGHGRVWWRGAYNGSDSASAITCHFYRGDNKLLIAYQNASAVETLSELDYDNTSSSGIFFSRRYMFPREVLIKRIDIVHDKAVGTFVMSYNDPDDTVVSLSEAINTTTDDGKTSRELDFPCDVFQYRQGQGPGEIRLIRIFYAAIE